MSRLSKPTQGLGFSTTVGRSVSSLLLALTLSLASAVSYANPCADRLDVGGIGGTGSPALAAGGIGGTGGPALATGGIGGTGAPELNIAQNETAGVVGTITGFASICVNGLEVHYDESTPLTDNGQPAQIKQLAIGQVVAIEAQATTRGLVARKLAILHAVVGPVSRSESESFDVLGQRIHLPASAQAPRLGDTVRVSGLRNADGDIIASRVETSDPLAHEHSVIGTVRNGRIGGLELESTQALREGQTVLVRGESSGGRLQVRQLAESPERSFGERADTVVIEAIVHERSERSLRAGAFKVELDDRTQFAGGRREDAGRDRLVRIIGKPQRDGSLRAARIEFRVRHDHDHSGSQGEREALRSDDDPDSHRGRGRGRGGDDARDASGDRLDDHSGRGPGSGHNNIERPDRSDSGSDRSGRGGRGSQVESSERIERLDRVDRSGRGGGDRPERIDHD